MQEPRIEKHPDPIWRLDHHAQDQLIESTPRLWRRLFGCLLGATGVLVILGVLQSHGALKTGSPIGWWVFGGGFFLFPILLFWLRGRPKCSACGRRMKRQFINLGRGGGNEHEFMVCHACKRYADTFMETGG